MQHVRPTRNRNLIRGKLYSEGMSSSRLGHRPVCAGHTWTGRDTRLGHEPSKPYGAQLGMLVSARFPCEMG